MFEMERKTDWYYWKPRRGRHKDKTKYVCLTTSETWGTIEAILASDNPRKEYSLNMHKGQITDYQWQTNCEKIVDEDLTKRLNFRFIKYKAYWRDMKIKKEAKALLMRGGR